MDIQRDAQEFGKLFLDHLDKRFRTQAEEDLRETVTQTFQGTQVNVVKCSKCGTKSEREEVFDDVVITLQKNCKLEERLAEYLRPEKLDGDNQYHCSRCDSKQDATRYTELTHLPPMLHFSIARFVWDHTGERQKSKSVIRYPMAIDMAPFVRPRPAEPLVYDLRGALLHKGASAHHGHYESQAYDVSRGRWFNFNDNLVSELPEEDEAAPVTLPKKRPAKGVIEDSDDEVQILSYVKVSSGLCEHANAVLGLYRQQILSGGFFWLLLT